VPPGDSAQRPSADAGMSTVEYAVGTVVAAAFAAVLYKIVTGDSVIAGLTNLINTALNTTF
jgi:large-conductance mechanosensitive channel